MYVVHTFVFYIAYAYILYYMPATSRITRVLFTSICVCSFAKRNDGTCRAAYLHENTFFSPPFLSKHKNILSFDRIDTRPPPSYLLL